MRYIRIFLVSAWVLFTLTANAQDADSYQRGYKNGKDLFNLGKYELAMEAFKPLTKQESGNPYTEYASFYYALAAHKTGLGNTAKDMFLQLAQKYPGWEKSDDVYYWLSAIYFDQGAFNQGVKASAKIKSSAVKEDVTEMKIYYLEKINDIEVLKELLQQNPYDLEVAKVLAYKISERPATAENAQLLDFLINEFNLDKAKFEAVSLEESQKKDSYKVAVLFPFMLEELEDERGIQFNQFVLDTYEGLRLAVEKLNSEGKNIDLYAYDTKKDSATTASILSSPEIRQMDLIIGPLYPVPSKLVSEYTYKHKINMLNPLSSNSEVIGGNPMSFLFKPSLETQAKAAAAYAGEAFKATPYTMIVYGETAKDSVLAHTYKKEVEERGLKVVAMERIGPSKARYLLDLLTKNAKDEEQNEEEIMAQDTLGHIFIATSDELVVANAISALEIRGDKLPVVTLEDWLDLKFVSYEQLERLQIRFIAPDYINYEKEGVEAFKKAFIEKTNSLPSQYAYTGYDMMLFFGNMLHEFGNYFQQGFANEGFKEGNVFAGYVYRENNDNQYVPIVQFKDAALELINKETDKEKQ